MTRRLVALAIPVLLLGIFVACSSGGDDSDDSGSSETRPAGVSSAAPRPTNRPATTPTSSAADAGDVPTFEDGDWTGGQAEVRITGSDTRTITGTLLQRSSSTDGGNTRLTFTAGLDTILISISTEFQPFDMSASQGGTFSTRIPFGSDPCTVTYQETSEQRISGTFRCEDAEIEIGPNLGPAVMEGSFTATR